MRTPTNQSVSCGDIDEDLVELHAMDKLQNEYVLGHIESCESCMQRVSEQRAYIEALKLGLKEL
jgi:hypothetical protein